MLDLLHNEPPFRFGASQTHDFCRTHAGALLADTRDDHHRDLFQVSRLQSRYLLIVKVKMNACDLLGVNGDVTACNRVDVVPVIQCHQLFDQCRSL